MEEFDTIVIGAGHQGLIAGTVLAEGGLSTLVVEAGPTIGGAIQSGEVTEPGAVHDLFATNMNLFLGSPFYAHHSDVLAAEGLRFARSAHPFASVFPNGTSLRVSSDEEATLQMWKRHSAVDAAGWQRLRGVFEAAAAAYLPLYTSSPQPSWAALTAGTGSAPHDPAAVSAPELAALFLSSTRAFGDRYFATDEAKAAAAAWGMHQSYGPDIAGGAVFSLLEMYADMLGGLSVVEGGASRLPQAIAGLLRRRGGVVMTGAPVARVEVDTTGATGVTLADGRRLRARRGVIATTTLPHLVRDLLAHTEVPEVMRAAADAERFGLGTFMLHLSLTGPVPWRDERLSRFAYVHVGGYVDDMARTYQQAVAQQLPDAPLLVVGQTSVVDATRVRTPGRHIVRVMVRMVPARISGDAAGLISSTRWPDVRERFADRVMGILEAYAPGLADLVTARVGVTPDDLQRINGNLVGGDTRPGSHQLAQMLTPHDAPSQYHTAIPGLYVAGAGTWPGVGVNGVSGRLAAEELLREQSAAGRGTPPE